MSIIIAGVIVAGAIVYNPSSQPVRNGNEQVVDEQPDSFETPTADDDVVLGEASAPVEVIIFGDYQCPYCERLYQDTEKKLREEYVKAGKVKVVYRDYPLSGHPAAQPAAEAAECAGDQGKYWQYHDALFERQATIMTLDYIGLAGELGLNKAAFQSCVETHKFAAEVAKDLADGTAAGVDGTPASFVNGQLISGAVPYASFKTVIDSALAETE